MKKIFLIIAMCKFSAGQCQLSATLITYNCSFNLAKQKSNIQDAKDENVDYYLDLYSYEDKVRSKVRNTSDNSFASLIKDFIYTQGSTKMFSLDDNRSMAFEINMPPLQLKKTGHAKKIINYQCEQWVNEAGTMEFWMTEQLSVNLSPTGNIGILGTVLEFISTSGTHLQASSINQSQISASEFEIPAGYSTMKANKSFSQIESERKKWEGKELPIPELTDIKGKKYNAGSLKGKIVIINFWFTTCRPCIEEMAELNELVKAYRDKTDVVFIAIAPDSKEKLQNFLITRSFNYILIPGLSEYIQSLGVNGFPTNMILDKEGKVYYESTGYIGKEGEIKEKYSSLISKLLGKN